MQVLQEDVLNVALAMGRDLVPRLRAGVERLPRRDSMHTRRGTSLRRATHGAGAGMNPYRSEARSAMQARDPFARPPKHPRITIRPATCRPEARPDLSVPFVWGLCVAFVIVLVDALVRG